MKVLIVTALMLVPGFAQADIYRCDTPNGVVFSDRECGDSSEVVTLADETAGISVGPSEEVRERLAEQKAERAQAREERAERLANQPVQVPTPVVIERQGYPTYPGFWGNRPPALRPPPPLRPLPPVAPPVRPPDVVRPR